MGLISGIILLFLSHIYLEKKGLPSPLETLKLRYVILLTVGLIFIIILIGPWLPFGEWLVGSVTIVCATVTAYKYRKKFEKMERGEQV